MSQQGAVCPRNMEVISLDGNGIYDNRDKRFASIAALAIREVDPNR